MIDLDNACIFSSRYYFKSLTKPELIFQVSKADPIVTPLPGKVCQAVLTTLEHLETKDDMTETEKHKPAVQTEIADIPQCCDHKNTPIQFKFSPLLLLLSFFFNQLTQLQLTKVLFKKGVIFTATYNPSAFVSGHVTVHLHSLAGVSVYVNGVDAAQRFSIQQVLGTILRCCKQTTSWRGADEQWRQVRVFKFCEFIHSVYRDLCRTQG